MRFPEITRDDAVALAQRAAVFGLRAFATYVVAPAAALAQHAKKVALSYVPSYVSEVLLVEARDGPSAPRVRPVYRAADYYFSWHRAHHTTTYLDGDGCYYAITVWDPQEASYRSYFLNANHLCRALGIRSVGNWWALSDYGIVAQLRAYQASMRASCMGIYDLSVGGKYVLNAIAEYHKSLELPKNACAKAVYALLAHAGAPGVALPTAAEELVAAAAAPAPEPEPEGETPKAPATPDAAPPASHPLAMSPSGESEPVAPAPAPAPVAPPAPAPAPEFAYEVRVVNYELDENPCKNMEPLSAL